MKCPSNSLKVFHGHGTSEIIYLPICLKIIKDGDESQWMNYVFLKKNY